MGRLPYGKRGAPLSERERYRQSRWKSRQQAQVNRRCGGAPRTFLKKRWRAANSARKSIPVLRSKKTRGTCSMIAVACSPVQRLISSNSCFTTLISCPLLSSPATSLESGPQRKTLRPAAHAPMPVVGLRMEPANRHRGRPRWARADRHATPANRKTTRSQGDPLPPSHRPPFRAGRRTRSQA